MAIRGWIGWLLPEGPAPPPAEAADDGPVETIPAAPAATCCCGPCCPDGTDTLWLYVIYC